MVTCLIAHNFLFSIGPWRWCGARLGEQSLKFAADIQLLTLVETEAQIRYRIAVDTQLQLDQAGDVLGLDLLHCVWGD